MSFLGDIVSSISSDRAPPPPRPLSQPPSANAIRSNNDDNRPTARPSTLGSLSAVSGVKRKADDTGNSSIIRPNRPNPTPGLTSSINIRSGNPPLSGLKSPGPAKPNPISSNTALKASSSATSGAQTPTLTQAAAGKGPLKGSYADIMARAKARQEQNAQTPPATATVAKYPAQSKEKRLSKLAERRRVRQEKQMGDKRPSSRPMSSKNSQVRKASPSKADKERKVGPRPPAPPMHGPPKPAYRGTMGISSGRSAPQSEKRRGRNDDYLGTDEEDEDGWSYGEDEGDEQRYDSDASSDMEAGASDIEREEAAALRAAKNDDATELATEQRMKQEKEERRKRLLAMSKKQK